MKDIIKHYLAVFAKDFRSCVDRFLLMTLQPISFATTHIGHDKTKFIKSVRFLSYVIFLAITIFWVANTITASGLKLPKPFNSEMWMLLILAAQILPASAVLYSLVRIQNTRLTYVTALVLVVYAFSCFLLFGLAMIVGQVCMRFVDGQLNTIVKPLVSSKAWGSIFRAKHTFFYFLKQTIFLAVFFILPSVWLAAILEWNYAKSFSTYFLSIMFLLVTAAVLTVYFPVSNWLKLLY